MPKPLPPPPELRTDVSVLYCDPRSVYPQLVADWWDEKRDARLYAGPNPVVAHPPCGPWSRLRHMYKGSEHDCAPRAVEQVRQFGGVLEHPAESRLWADGVEMREPGGTLYIGLPWPGELPDPWGGRTIEVRQVEWGHVAQKRTWLYMVGCQPAAPAPFPDQRPTHHVSRDAKRARRNGYTLKRTSKKQNLQTPLQFALWLLDLAARAKKTEAA